MSWKYFFVVFGYAEAVGMTVVLFHIFINAFLNDYKWVVYINRQGEALIELIFLLSVTVFIFGGLFYVIRDLEHVEG